MRASQTKDRDMARSILPCKNRGAARAAKAGIKRAARHAIDRELRAVALLSDLDEWDAAADLRREPRSEISWAVRWRRGGDKLNHFERWAVAITRDLRPEDRLGSVASRLPRGLIGDHALSHLRRRPELNPQLALGHRRLAWERRHRAQAEALSREQRELEQAIRSLMEAHDGHRSLNAAMKAAVPLLPEERDRPPYLLRDIPGIEAFVAGLYVRAGRDPYRAMELEIVQALVRGRGRLG